MTIDNHDTILKVTLLKPIILFENNLSKDLNFKICEIRFFLIFFNFD